MKLRVVHKHALLIRWNHWINFPVLTVMIWSGFLIYWANPAYFIPGSWLDKIGFNYQLAKGMGWHFSFGLVFTLNGLCYLGYLFWSGQGRYLWPRLSSWREAFLVLLHDLKLRRTPLPPPVKYNAAQRLAYTGVIVLGVLGVLTGFAMYKPVQLSFLAAIFGGYRGARLIHFLVAMSFILFFLVHIVQVVRAGWNQFRSMVTGWEKIDE